MIRLFASRFCKSPSHYRYECRTHHAFCAKFVCHINATSNIFVSARSMSAKTKQEILFKLASSLRILHELLANGIKRNHWHILQPLQQIIHQLLGTPNGYVQQVGDWLIRHNIIEIVTKLLRSAENTKIRSCCFQVSYMVTSAVTPSQHCITNVHVCTVYVL